MTTLTRAGIVAATALAAALMAGCTPQQTTPPSPSVTPAMTNEPTVQPSRATEIPAPQGDFFNAGSSAFTAYGQLVAEGREDDAQLIMRIAEQPSAVWMGDWQTPDTARSTAQSISSSAHEANQIAVLVIYAIPGRDCGLHSAGGLPEQSYLTWVQAVADGIVDGGGDIWVVLEPDALPQMGDCPGQGDRAGLLGGAARILSAAGASVFLDAGHSNWRSVDDTVNRINEVGTEHLRGFATNTSNYNATELERAWGEQVASRTGLEFVVDTSRNGNGSNGEWCNPRGMALGEPPALTGQAPMVATLWTKVPGESDGTCNGGPPAGQWWMEVALELARNA